MTQFSKAKFEEEPELCIFPHMPQIKREDSNIKTMLISQLPQFDDSLKSYWHSIVSDLAHDQPDKNMSVLNPQTTTTTKSAVAEELVPQASALDKRGRPIGEHEITYLKVAQIREILPVDQWLQSQMHNEAATYTSSAEAASVAQHMANRATEICGMFCPECWDEERPGCCINPRGHRDNHYCGKCGNTDKRSNRSIWKGTPREPQFVTAFDQAPFYGNEAGSKT